MGKQAFVTVSKAQTMTRALFCVILKLTEATVLWFNVSIQNFVLRRFSGAEWKKQRNESYQGGKLCYNGDLIYTSIY